MISFIYGLLGKLFEVVSIGSMGDFVRPVVCVACVPCIILYAQGFFYIRIYITYIYNIYIYIQYSCMPFGVYMVPGYLVVIDPSIDGSTR